MGKAARVATSGLLPRRLAILRGVRLENIARQSGSMDSPPAQRFAIPPFDTRAPQAIRSSEIIAVRHHAPAIPQGEYFRAVSLAGRTLITSLNHILTEGNEQPARCA